MYTIFNPLLAHHNEEVKIPLLPQSPSSAKTLPCVRVASTSPQQEASECLKLTSGDAPTGDVYIKVSAAAAASASTKCPECQTCALEAEAEELLLSRPWFNCDLFAVVVSHIVSFWLLYLASLVIDKVAYVVYGAVGYELLSITAAVNLLLAFANRDAFYAPIYHHPVMVLLLWFIFAIQWGAFAFCLFIVTSSNT